jgi:hypothetical protein
MMICTGNLLLIQKKLNSITSSTVRIDNEVMISRLRLSDNFRRRKEGIIGGGSKYEGKLKRN